MKKKTFKELIKFAVVCWSGAIIKFLLFTLFNEVFKWEYWICYLVSMIIALIYTFILNKFVTFKTDSSTTRSLLLYALFNILFIPLSTLLIDFLTDKGWNEYLSLGVVMVINFWAEFVYDKLLAFKDKKATNN